MPGAAGRRWPILAPASQAATFATARAAATIAPTVTASGRSPSRSGVSAARAAAFLASERDGRLAANCGLRLERGDQRARRGLGVVRVADRADHDDPARAGGRHPVR